MDINAFRESVHQVLEAICGHPFDSWQFNTLWIIALVEIFFFGFIFARGVGRSEKNFITIFIGNLVTLILLVLAAGVVKFFFEPRIDQPWVVNTLMWIAGVWLAFIWVFVFARVLWGNGRITALIAVSFTLAVSYGGMWVGQKVIDIAHNAEYDIEYYKEKQEQATEAVKDAMY